VSDTRAWHALTNIYKVHFNAQEQALALFLAERNAGLTMKDLQLLGPEFFTAARRLARFGFLAHAEGDSYHFQVEFLGQWLRDWEEYDEELDRLDLEALKRRLERQPVAPHSR
jgi:hypothetical protein